MRTRSKACLSNLRKDASCSAADTTSADVPFEPLDQPALAPSVTPLVEPVPIVVDADHGDIPVDLQVADEGETDKDEDE